MSNSGMKISLQAATNANRAETKVGISKSNSTSSGLILEPAVVEGWTAQKNLRFKELSRKEALEDLSIEELSELNSLTRLRRFKKFPRSADEILWQRRQQKLTRGLLRALQDYVEFHEAPSHT
jgi:hypothetical protein